MEYVDWIGAALDRMTWAHLNRPHDHWLRWRCRNIVLGALDTSILAPNFIQRPSEASSLMPLTSVMVGGCMTKYGRYRCAIRPRWALTITASGLLF